MCSRRITSGLSVDQEVELQCLVHQLQLSDGASGTSSSVLVTPLSPDRTSLIKKFYFPDETDEYETSIEIANMIDEIVSHDEYRMRCLW